jgi:hypothetical protein
VITSQQEFIIALDDTVDFFHSQRRRLLMAVGTLFDLPFEIDRALGLVIETDPVFATIGYTCILVMVGIVVVIVEIETADGIRTIGASIFIERQQILEPKFREDVFRIINNVLEFIPILHGWLNPLLSLRE